MEDVFDALDATVWPLIDHVDLRRVNDEWALTLSSAGATFGATLRVPVSDLANVRLLLEIPKRIIVRQEEQRVPGPRRP